MAKNGQIATQYVDMDGNPTMDIHFNPNTSMMAIEGITSPDGRVLGKMGHSERIGQTCTRTFRAKRIRKSSKAVSHTSSNRLIPAGM